MFMDDDWTMMRDDEWMDRLYGNNVKVHTYLVRTRNEKKDEQSRNE